MCGDALIGIHRSSGRAPLRCRCALRPAFQALVVILPWFVNPSTGHMPADLRPAADMYMTADAAYPNINSTG